MAEQPQVQIEIRVYSSKGPEHPIPIYGVTLRRHRDWTEVEYEHNSHPWVWDETWGSWGELRAFLQGLRAAFGTLGRFDINVPTLALEDWVHNRLGEAPFQLWPEKLLDEEDLS